MRRRKAPAQLLVREVTLHYSSTGQSMPDVELTHPALAANLLLDIIPHGPQERVVVVGLDARLRPVGWHLTAAGSIGGAGTSVAGVFRWALVAGANSIILGHNHPSGDPRPSESDTELTRRVTEVGELLGIPLLDHIVVGGEGCYWSFAQNDLFGHKEQRNGRDRTP